MRVLEITRGTVPTDSTKRPFLDLCVYLNEDGTFSGDVVSVAGQRRLPKDCKISFPERFFAIPESMSGQQEYLRGTEHPSEIILTLRDAEFKLGCSFLLSQIDAGSPIPGAVAELEQLIKKITDPAYEPPKLTPEQEHAAAVHRQFALHEAAISGEPGLIDEIIKTYPEQLHQENGNGLIPLEQAVWFGNAATVALLVRYGSDVNVKDGFGQTPLHIACTVRDLEKVAVLMENGADINAAKSDGWRPIHYALMMNCHDIVQYLKGKGAQFDPNDDLAKEAKQAAKKWQRHL